jgi:hypothetical protein
VADATMGLRYRAKSSFMRCGLAGSVLLKMYDGDNRLVIDHSASIATVALPRLSATCLLKIWGRKLALQHL